MFQDQIRVGIHKLYFKIAQENAARYEELDLEYEDLQIRATVAEELDLVSSAMEDVYTQQQQSERVQHSVN